MEERLAYYHAAKKDGFENGIRTAIVGILASPHFLFRTDDVAADSEPMHLDWIGVAPNPFIG